MICPCRLCKLGLAKSRNSCRAFSRSLSISDSSVGGSGDGNCLGSTTGSCDDELLGECLIRDSTLLLGLDAGLQYLHKGYDHCELKRNLHILFHIWKYHDYYKNVKYFQINTPTCAVMTPTITLNTSYVSWQTFCQNIYYWKSKMPPSHSIYEHSSSTTRC